MAEARVEENEGIEVWVVGCEVLSFVECVEVFDVGRDFHRAAERFDDTAEWILRRTFRQGKLVVAICHGFRTDEDEVED